MKSSDRESFREDKPSNDRNDVSSPSSVPMNPAAWAPQLWTHAAEALIDWYSVMFRLAFGLGRVNSVLTATEQPSANAAPARRPLALVESRSALPVNLRSKRRNPPSKVVQRSRSSKKSGVKRSRRAA